MYIGCSRSTLRWQASCKVSLNSMTWTSVCESNERTHKTPSYASIGGSLAQNLAERRHVFCTSFVTWSHISHSLAHYCRVLQRRDFRYRGALPLQGICGCCCCSCWCCGGESLPARLSWLLATLFVGLAPPAGVVRCPYDPPSVSPPRHVSIRHNICFVH